MANMINWFEIPAANFDRAVAFYREILGVEISESEMMGTRMGFFPADDSSVSGAIVQGEGNVPSTDGSLLYLNGGSDLTNVLDRIESAGGSIILGKTEIAPEVGYFALFLDSEGNRVALHSMN